MSTLGVADAQSLLNGRETSWATGIAALSYCISCNRSGFLLNILVSEGQLLIFYDVLVFAIRFNVMAIILTFMLRLARR